MEKLADGEFEFRGRHIIGGVLKHTRHLLLLLLVVPPGLAGAGSFGSDGDAGGGAVSSASRLGAGRTRRPGSTTSCRKRKIK